MSWTTMFKIALGRTPLGTALGHVPLVEKVYAWHTLRRVECAGLFVGVYDSYAEAQQAIPQSRDCGWNNEESSKIWINHVDYMQPTAYAPFFWLSNLLREGTTLVDYGGSIGLSYYSYTKRRQLPPHTRWIVVEVPQLTDAGRRVAQREHAEQLEFLSDLASAPPCDLLFSAGALQYIEESVPGFLEKLPALPRRILLNKVPLSNGRAYWTLENFGTALSPYHVYNEKEFLSYFENAGYVLRDRWKVHDLSLDVPFHTQCCVPQFSGLYLERAA